MTSNPSWSESPPPTAATPRTDRATFGTDVAATSRMLGVELMGWQCLTADRALEHVAGQLVYREVDIAVPRQSGKSSLILAVCIRKMLSAPGTLVTYTSASRLSARRKLLRTWWPLIQNSPVAGMFTVTKGTGSESLECSNGSTMVLLSGDESSGHGDSVDLGVLDEAWSLTEASEQAVRPAMSARPNGQLWVVSTAGTAKSAYWRNKVDAGRTSAELGMTEGTCFVEWAATADVDVTDPAEWPVFMPALGRTITEETVAADLGSMLLPQFRRAYCNQWGDEVDAGGWAVISEDVWKAAQL